MQGQTEVGLFSEKSLRRTGLTDLIMRAGFDVRAFHVRALLEHERLVHGAAAMVVDLEMERQPPSAVLGTLRDVMPHVPRFAIGSRLQFAALVPGQAVYLAEGDERPEQLARCLREALLGTGTGAAAEPPPAGEGALAKLTPRQRDVMAWLAVGTDNLKIAAELGVGERAVKVHVTTLLERFALDNRTELALLAWRAGFRPPVH